MSSDRHKMCARYRRKVSRESNVSPKCAVCGWGFNMTPFRGSYQWSSSIHFHHIIPASAGGLHDDSNIIVLCPNHHRVADMITGKGKNVVIWTRQDLISALIAIDSEKEAWWAYYTCETSGRGGRV